MASEEPEGDEPCAAANAEERFQFRYAVHVNPGVAELGSFAKRALDSTIKSAMESGD